MTTIEVHQPSHPGLLERARRAVVVVAARLTPGKVTVNPKPRGSAAAYDRFFGHFGLTRGDARSAIVAQLFDEPPVRARIAPIQRRRQIDLEI